MKIFALHLFLGFLTILPSCENMAIKAGYVKKTKAEAQLTQLQLDYNKKLDTKVLDITNTKDALILSKDNQIKGAANGLYGANATFGTITNPNRTDLVTNNFVNEGWAALNHIMPDYQTILDINTRLKKELDEKQTSLDQLNKTHQEVLASNQKLADGTKVLQDKLASLEKEKNDLAVNYEKDRKIKQDAVDEANAQLNALKDEKLKNLAALNAAKMKISMVLGGFALAALAGAIWSPVFKDKFGIFAAILGIASIGVWYIQPWMLGLVFGLAVLGLIIWAVYNHNKESKTALATYSALQEIKDKSKQVWDNDIAPTLKSWQTKYVKTGGAITEVSDPSIAAHIDQKLAETNQK